MIQNGTRHTDPLMNWEPAPEELVQSTVTDPDLCFIRSHGPTPSGEDQDLIVDGLVDVPLQLSIEDLGNMLTEHEVTCVLCCAGNRRAEFLKVGEYPGEVTWDLGAMANVSWRGYLLRDLLAAAGVGEGAMHVCFESFDECVAKGEKVHYGTSIPLETALSGQVLLATHMSGQPLPPDHGGPLRVVVPGHIGAKSVKWLRRITLSEEPSEKHYYQRAYRIVPVGSSDWESAPPIERFPVTSAICVPRDGAVIHGPEFTVRGYAASGYGAIKSVEISVDGGVSWRGVELLNEPVPYAWVLWSCAVSLPAGSHTLMVRAFDDAGGSQPDSMAEIANLKGYLNNAVQRVQVELKWA